MKMPTSTTRIFDEYQSVVPGLRAKQKEKIKRRTPMSDAIREELAKRTKEEASHAKVAGKEEAVSMVTVACKLPSGFIMECDWDFVEVNEPTILGPKSAKVWQRRKNGRRFLIRGNRVPLAANGVQQAPSYEISTEGGYAFTKVPRDAFESWWKQIGHSWTPCEGDSPMVFCLEHKSALARARELENLHDNLKPIKPMELDPVGKPIGDVDPRTKSFRQVATADELAEKMGIQNNSIPINRGISAKAAESMVGDGGSQVRPTLANG
jgi:hypothetical protein